MAAEYYEPAEFYGCEITGSSMERCGLSSCIVKNSDIEGLTIIDSNTEDSDFLTASGISWPDGTME